MTQLSDTQATILSAAAGRDDGAVFPLPDSIRARGAALDRSLSALLKRGLVSETTASPADPGSRTDEDGRCVSLAITPAGLEAIGIEAESPGGANKAEVTDSCEAPPAGNDADARQRPTGKLAFVLESVERDDGATLLELTDRTGWQPHTTRAALTRLRQRGFPIALETRDGRKAYRIAGEAQ
jgi:DNA-binding MarR family transcriptional regulator